MTEQQYASLVVDLAAREDATKALTMIQGHEDNCGDRYSEINSSLTRVHDRVDSVQKLIIANLAAIIVAGISVAATLLSISN